MKKVKQSDANPDPGRSCIVITKKRGMLWKKNLNWRA
jgi:hypothetical protein